MKVRNALAAGGLAVALVAFPACGGGTESNKVGTAGSGTPDPPSDAYRVGDIVKFGDAEVTVHGFKDPFDAASLTVKAPPGSRHVSVDVEMKNRSARPQVLSSFAQFEMKDSTNKTYNAIPLPADQPAIGGEVQPGSARRGVVAFTVPETSKGLQVVFKNILFKSGTVSFYLA